MLLATIFALTIDARNNLTASTLPPALVAQDDTEPNGQVKTTAYSAWLEEKGIEPTQKGLFDYLTSLKPNSALRDKAKSLMMQLSDRDYAVREKATLDLKSIAGITVAVLNSLDHELVTSAEGRYRLEDVIKAKKALNAAQIQSNVLREITVSEIKGLAQILIESEDHFEQEPSVLAGLENAIAASATSADLQLLKDAFRESKPDSSLRTGCFRALVAVGPDIALELALKNRSNAKGRFGLAVAKLLFEEERVESFDTLVGMLEQEDKRSGLIALSVIRNTTGLKFQDNYLRDKASVEKAVKETKTWLEAQETGDIKYVWEAETVQLGRRLISHYDKNVVVELDESNNIVWSTNLKKPFTCMGLPNGHRIIVEYQSGSIVEFDETGKEVKRFENLSKSMSGMCRRANGNLVIAAGQNDSSIFELDDKGKKVKSFNVEGTPTSVEIAENGNLVCALYKLNEIVELDSKGTVVNRIKIEGAPYHATPLKSGNYLVAFAKDKKIAEYDSSGTEVWKIACAKGAYRAQELSDGTIVFADSLGIHHVDRTGKELKYTDLTVSGNVHYSFSY